ncbi:MAG: hypothetical protein J0I68_28655 [Achromobacter sp.]|uniref:hypothetical protein n=1 Tax=unclassified Achromobacter TaxID=2626865 RepID=UPI0006C6211E|nr:MULTISPECIES: hypothetical protein [unclassified Achromobacter]MBN9642532.1 hypothetical protein [Achromobacter sp.]CUJ43360.1 Uncharacterised protein [Achromobacter sp. 2789STDY5608621]
MSKQDIRPQGAEGISHPRNVAKAPLTVNDSSTSRLLLAADNELVCWIEASVEALLQLEELLKAIDASVRDQRYPNPAAALGRISKLAAMGAYVASDIANGADCGRERFQELAAPFRAAAGGAE